MQTSKREHTDHLLFHETKSVKFGVQNAEMSTVAVQIMPPNNLHWHVILVIQ